MTGNGKKHAGAPPPEAADLDLGGAVERLRELHAAGPAVSGRGLEAMIAGATLGVSKKTWLLPGRRELGAALLRGAAPEALHSARPYRVVPAGPSPSARAGQAVGLGMAGESALCFLGTGSVAYGTLAEVLAHLVPGVQFVVSWYHRPGPFARPVSPIGLFRTAGLSVAEVDGSDAIAVYDAVRAGTVLVMAAV
ncbi:MAG: hypothetical protein EXR69_11450 [Myxococcales bacterium]|nr:hypothetical protein [Myxococcales bacterium]